MFSTVLLSLLLSATTLTPTISPVTGTYTGTVTVTVSPKSAGSVIRCTQDGSTPVLGSTRYTAPFEVVATSTVRCKAWVKDKKPSQVAVATYTVTPIPPDTYPGELRAFHVGPGQTYATIGAVPWYTLLPGDTVYIHYRAAPYYEKFLISTKGTSDHWVRVIGVLGPGGERPVISGNNATTSTNNRYRWLDPSYFQIYGLIHVGPNTSDVVPAYVEIANLEIMDTGDIVGGTWQGRSFTAENGTSQTYAGFSACIYARGVDHLTVRNNVIHGCGLGFYNWTAGDSNLWWDSLQKSTLIQGNYFYNNGTAGYTEHQVYTESLGVVVEYNHFGPQRSGASGSQFKDRSAGTVFRYNLVEESNGYFIDLVEPENGWGDLGSTNPNYGQDFVYGNILINRGNSSNLVHWSEDHGQDKGRQAEAGAKLYFYNNTIFALANAEYWPTFMFNQTLGAYECGTGPFPGRIDVRNNIFVLQAATGGTPNTLQWGYCGYENFDFGVNWISPGWSTWHFTGGVGTMTGTANLFSPVNNDPGFVNSAANDFHLTAVSNALGLGAALPATITSAGTNPLGLNLTPVLQYLAPVAPNVIPSTTARAQSGAGSDLGAFERAVTGYSVAGTIASGSGTTVSLTGASTATVTADANGAFSFTGLANGSYTVTPTRTGYVFSPSSRAVTVSGDNVTGLIFTGMAGTNIIFFDDFNGPTIDTTAWSVMNRAGDYSNAERQCYAPGQVTTSNGNLIITSVNQTTICGDAYHTPSSFGILSGYIQWNTFNFTYGTVEWAGTVAGGRAWPAVWMLGSNCQQTNKVSADNTGLCNWPQAGSDEIDISEFYGSQGTPTTDYQNIYSSSAGNFSCNTTVSNANTNRHVYQIIWNASGVTWKVDGVTTCSTGVHPTTPMFLIVNTAAQVSSLDVTPTSSTIEYIKVTQP